MSELTSVLDAPAAVDVERLSAGEQLEFVAAVTGPEDTALAVIMNGDRPAGDLRSHAGRQGGALVAPARGALDGGSLPDVRGDRPHVRVTIDWQALSAARAAPGVAGGEPGRAGPITPETARRLACDSSVARVITGPDGLPPDVGRAQRTATTAIRRVVRDPGTARWHTFRPDGTASKLAVATGTARRPTHGSGPSRRPPPLGHWSREGAGRRAERTDHRCPGRVIQYGIPRVEHLGDDRRPPVDRPPGTHVPR